MQFSVSLSSRLILSETVISGSSLEVLENSLKCTITFASCFRYIPPIGRGIIPLAEGFESPVHTSATLFLAQALQIGPKILADPTLFLPII